MTRPLGRSLFHEGAEPLLGILSLTQLRKRVDLVRQHIAEAIVVTNLNISRPIRIADGERWAIWWAMPQAVDWTSASTTTQLTMPMSIASLGPNVGPLKSRSNAW